MSVFGQVLSASFEDKQLGLVFTGYFIFGLYMTIAATQMSKILFIIICFVDILFACLSLSNFGIQPQLFVPFAGISVLIIALLSFYASAAQFSRLLLAVLFSLLESHLVILNKRN